MIVNCRDCAMWVRGSGCSPCNQGEPDTGECRANPPASDAIGHVRIHTDASYGCAKGIRAKSKKK